MSAPAPALKTRLPYRPALDGLRAVAILGVLVFHLNPGWLKGGWLGVDLFFVLSGFLITNLLVAEQDRWGRISVLSFWRARLRRLLPSLLTVLLFVVVCSWIWTTTTRRASVAWDIVSSLFYVSNWRFAFGDEQYFEQLAMPSPVRHTWSLSIEEQFYLVFPLLLMLIAFWARKRIVQSLIFAALAAGSAMYMAHLYNSEASISHIYYSTTTRAFELLIGVCAALFLGSSAFAEKARFSKAVGLLAWLGLGVVGAAMYFLDSEAPFVFTGGLVIVALAALLAILGAASGGKSWFSRVFGSPIPRFIGLISYPLYLWHWPIIVFLNSESTPLTGYWLAVVRTVISFLLAYLTYRFIEYPIRHREPVFQQSLFLSKIVTIAAAPLVLLGAFAIAHTEPMVSATSDVAVDEGVILTPVPYRAEEKRTAMVLGNSIPASLAAQVGTKEFPQLTLESATNIGCDPFDGTKLVDNKPVEPTRECLGWRKSWPDAVAQIEPDVLVFFIPQTLVQDFLDAEGKKVRFGTKEHDEFIAEALAQVLKGSRSGGAKSLALSTLACHDVPTFEASELEHYNDISRVKHINDVAAKWAAGQSDVSVIDTFGALCSNGYQPIINGRPLYGDGLHFTADSAPVFWAWMMPQVLQLADKANGS